MIKLGGFIITVTDTWLLCVFHSSDAQDGISMQFFNRLQIIDRTQSAAFLLPDTWRCIQEKLGILFKHLEWDRNKYLHCLLYALSLQRKQRPELQLEQLGMTKYFLTTTFPMEQLLWLSLFVPKMKQEVTHTTSILWSSAWEILSQRILSTP